MTLHHDYWLLILNVNTHMVCLGEIRSATVNILFSSTVISWACHLGANCVSWFMSGRNGRALWPDVGRLFFFLSWEAVIAKAVYKSHLGICERPQLETIWANWVTQSEGISSWTPTASSCAAFIKIYHHIVSIWLWYICMVYSYQTRCHDRYY